MREPDGGGGGGDYSGIDPERLGAMIRAVEDGAGRLRDACAAYRARFDAYGVDTGAFPAIDEIGKWAQDQLPMLRRRHNLAVALEHGGPPGLVYLTEPVVPADVAARTGRQLADRINHVDRVDGSGATVYHEVAQTLAAYADDPDVAAAFYANLQPNRLDSIPLFLYESGSKTAAEDLPAFSRAFGVAVSSPHPPPGFDKVTRDFLQTPPAPGLAWDRLALMQYGDFPPDFRTRAARGLVLDRLATEPDRWDFRGNWVEAGRLGLPADTVALALNAAAGDPRSARDVLNQMGGKGARDNIRLIFGYTRGRGTGDEVADALGRAIEKGAGVDSEQPGQHSADAARFAMDAMVAAGDVGADMPWTAQDSMVNLAMSYDHEIAAGSRIDVAEDRASGLDKPRYWTDVPGLTPSFYLAPRDTYEFLKTFVGREDLTERFDQDMGGLQHDVLVRAAGVDAAAVKAGKPDPWGYQRAAGTFGATAGFEYQAELKVRGDMDKADAQMRQLVGTVLTFGLGKIPNPEATAAKYGWMAFKWAAGKGISYWQKGDDQTRVHRVETDHDRMVLAAQYQSAAVLLEAGFPAQPPPPPAISEGDPPRLRPIDELAKDEGKLRAFNDWCDSTGVIPGTHQPAPNSFDAKMEGGANAATSDRPKTLAEQWG